MPTIIETIEIDAPREEIFATLATPSRMADWNALHTGFNGEVPELLSLTASFTQKVTIMGMPGEITWTVEELEEPSRLKLAGAGPMGTEAQTSLSLEDNGGTTVVTFETGFEGAALVAVQQPLEASSKKAATESLEKLKALHS